MRHRIAHKHFNRDVNHRKALLKNLVRSLVEEGEITTTIEKAKETKRIADKLIHKALTDSVLTRRTLHTFFGRRDVVNTLVDRIAPAMKDRVSGFTRLLRVGQRRGDNASLVTLSLINKPEVTGTLKSGKTHTHAEPVKAKKAKAEVVAPVETKAKAKKKAA
jgi:large subunit ribosomal protein L17